MRKRKTLLVLAAIACSSLALGIWGVRYFVAPIVSAQKKTPDSHPHGHKHTDKPKAQSPGEEPKGERTKEHKASITVSATPDKNMSPRMPLSSNAKVLLPHTEAVGVADAMIEAEHNHGHVKKPNAQSPREAPKEHSTKENKHEAHGEEGHTHEEHEHEHEEEHIVRISEGKRKELGIEVATAQPGSLKTQLSLSGTITLNTDRTVHVVSRIPGIVREVRKNLGDMVRAGEIMTVIDSRELADAKGAYLAAGERVSLTADTFQREKDLWEKKISPAEDYFKAKQAFAEARIELRLSKQKLLALGFSEPALTQLASESEASLTRYDVAAPLAGTVIEKHVNVGESVKDDTEIFHVADLRTLWVSLNVPPVDLVRVEKGQRVRLSAGAGLPEVEGRVSYIGSVVAEETRTVPVRVELPNPDGRFRPGLFVTASLTTKETTASVLIPTSAVQTIEGKPSVFVETPEGFEARSVTLGQSNATHVEITTGLRAGERYAATETFVLKADLAKSEAGHQH